MILAIIFVVCIVIYLIGFTVERLANDITNDVEQGCWSDEDE